MFRLRRNGTAPGAPAGASRRTRGQSLVEFALILPVMLVLLAGTIDLGRLFYAYVALENAAKEGALYGSQNPGCATLSDVCPDPQNVTWRIQNETGAAALPGGIQVGAIACLKPDDSPRDDKPCADGDTYVVNASHDFRLITPILGSIFGSGLTLSAQSRSKVLNEAFDPTPGAALLKYVCVDPGTTCIPAQTPTLDGDLHPVYLVANAGDTLRYQLRVTNIGGQLLTGLTISDSGSVPLPLGTSDCPALPASLSRNATWTCEYTRTAPNPAGGQPFQLITNSASFGAAEINSVPQIATVKVLARPAELLVTKYVNVFREGGDGDGTPGGFGNATSSTIYQPGTGSAATWYWVLVRNTGGQNATGVTITDSFGLPVTTDCPAPATTFAPNQLWGCYYQRTFSGGTTGQQENTVHARANNVTVDGIAAATVTVNGNASCSGTNRVVPNLIGLTFSAARSAWTAAGFTTALQPSSGNNGSTVVTQDRAPFSCIVRTIAGTVTRIPTP